MIMLNNNIKILLVSLVRHLESRIFERPRNASCVKLFSIDTGRRHTKSRLAVFRNEQDWKNLHFWQTFLRV